MAYIPYPSYYDDVPVDLSFVYKDEKPAGKHGFVKAAGDHFEFEDGAPARFWGTNFNGGACFPSFDYSEKVVRRLAKIGCNIVRFHQLDAEWDHPNIYAFTKGKRVANTLEFDKESMKRLDYLIYCLKNEGIYCYLDIMTYRKFKSGDNIEKAFEMGDTVRHPYCNYDRRMIELQKKSAYDLWNHFNPYTNLKYKDDPVIAMSEIVNENDLFARRFEHEPYISEFRELFRKWLDEKGFDFDAENCDLNNNVEPLISFKIHIQENYYKEMMSFMRSFGVKVPITGTNWTICDANMKAQLVTDYTDSHTYFYDWRWAEHRTFNVAVTQVPDPALSTLVRARYVDKPFFVSEWDMPWSNEYRAESPLYYAAVGAYQNWGGFTIHTYSYGTRLHEMNILGKEVSSKTIGNTAYREGIFSTWNDPAKFGLFYHSALITRRADVKPSPQTITVKTGKDKTEAFPLSAEYCGIVCTDADSGTEHDAGKRILNPENGEVKSIDGQLYRNWKDNYGYIDTPRTKCVYGFLEKNGVLSIDGLTVDCKTDFAVIAISSLTDDPLETTDNILLTTGGRARNTDAVFEGEQMLDYGRPPITVEVIEAEIRLKTNNPDMYVWAVNAEGFYTGRVPASYENGWLIFKTGEVAPSLYYLIIKE